MRPIIYISSALILFIIIFFGGVVINARDSYEDYRDGQGRSEQRDKPLSEIKNADREELLDDLRGAVREEIDESISEERKASKKKINKSKLIKDVRKIVKEEIEDAIKLKKKKYLAKGTWEVGGFFSMVVPGLKSSSTDNNFRIKVFPMANYFLGSTIALGIKGEADINATTGTKIFTLGLGPQFVYGINKDDSICFYVGLYAGISWNSSLTNKLGYRYGNELGIKFVMPSGVIINIGCMVVFDNGGDQITGFQNLIIPAVGISAWF